MVQKKVSTLIGLILLTNLRSKEVGRKIPGRNKDGVSYQFRILGANKDDISRTTSNLNLARADYAVIGPEKLETIR